MPEQHSVTGIVYELEAPQSFGEKGFQVRTIILHIPRDDGKEDTYPTYAVLQSSGKTVDVLNGIDQEDKVTLYYNFRGRHWDKGNRWFCTLDVWRADIIEKAPEEEGLVITQQMIDDTPF